MNEVLRKKIFGIAFPAIISNITTPLLAMIDVTIVGHLGSATYIAAIALGSSMFSMFYMLFGFLRMGSSGVTAQALGAGDRKGANAHLYRSLSIGLMIGLCILLFSKPISDILLKFMDAEPDTLPLARTYFLIAILGAPATLATYALSGWSIGMQNSRLPMWMALVTNVINICASLIFVFGFGMSIKGVAFGSVIAQWSGFIFGIMAILQHYQPGRPNFRRLFATPELKRFFTINSDIFLRTLCLVAVTVWFTRSGSLQGSAVLAANALLLQLFLFFSYFMDGFAFAGEALAGKFEGSRNYTELRRLIGALTRIGLILAVSFSLLYMFGGNVILGLLTDEDAVLAQCSQYRWWAVAVPLAGTMAFIWDGILIGLTLTRIMLRSMLAATLLFFGLYFATISNLGNHGLWLAFIIYLATRGVTEMALYRRKRRKKRDATKM